MFLSILGVIAVFYIGLTLLLFLLQNHLIYFPTRSIFATPASIGLDYEAIRFKADDGVTLSGWFIPAEGATDVVLFFHGNAGNISHRLESIALFHQLGLNVFIIDYRGYGASEGRPTETGTYLDAGAAWGYLVEDRGVAPEQIIIFGRSLGGAVAAWLAVEHPPKGLILESTFTSVPDMAARQFPFLPVRWLARTQYNTIGRLPQIHVPLLISHSPDDRTIPYSHGQRLFEVANTPKDFLRMKGGHNEGFVITGKSYEDMFQKFIATLN